MMFLKGKNFMKCGYSILKSPDSFDNGCVSDGKRCIDIPIHSEEPNEFGDFDIIGYRKEYVD